MLDKITKTLTAQIIEIIFYMINIKSTIEFAFKNWPCSYSIFMIVTLLSPEGNKHNRWRITIFKWKANSDAILIWGGKIIK